MSVIITFMFEPAKLQMNCASASGKRILRKAPRVLPTLTVSVIARRPCSLDRRTQWVFLGIEPEVVGIGQHLRERQPAMDRSLMIAASRAIRQDVSVGLSTMSGADSSLMVSQANAD